MEFWADTFFLLAVYISFGLSFAILREARLGGDCKPGSVEVFLAVTALWPIALPILGLIRLCKWAWTVGFNRNLKPTGSSPGREIKSHKDRHSW
jgi:hypothetical protein